MGLKPLRKRLPPLFLHRDMTLVTYDAVPTLVTIVRNVFPVWEQVCSTVES